MNSKKPSTRRKSALEVSDQEKEKLISKVSKVEQDQYDLVELDELKYYLNPLTLDEYAILESDILSNGQQEPIKIVMYDGKRVIIDGHNRYNICLKHGIQPKIHLEPLTDLDEIKIWILKRQLGRRNLSDKDRIHYLGILYNTNKQSEQKRSSNGMFKKTGNVAETIAKDHNISEKTVRRSGIYASGLGYLVPRLQQKVKTEKFVTDDAIRSLVKFPPPEKLVSKRHLLNYLSELEVKYQEEQMEKELNMAKQALYRLIKKHGKIQIQKWTRQYKED